MYHAGTENLRPSRLLADSAPCAMAEQARNIDFRTGFGKWEEAGAEANPAAGAEERTQEFGQHAFEMRHRDDACAVNHEAFNLAEHGRGAHAQFVGPVAIARAYDRQRWLAPLHHADLPVRGMSAEEQAAGQE